MEFSFFTTSVLPAGYSEVIKCSVSQDCLLSHHRGLLNLAVFSSTELQAKTLFARLNKYILSKFAMLQLLNK